jgi:flagellar protein FlbD
MIRLTRLNQVPLVLNSDLIEHIEMTPDTVISLTSGQKFMVRETSDQVIERVIEFRRAVCKDMSAYGLPGAHSSPEPAESTLGSRKINDRPMR